MMSRFSSSLQTPSARRWILLAAFVLFAWNIWGYDLWAPDEPFFGEGAREMIADGRWLVPFVNGEVNNHKPPLFFWLIALFSLPFGEVLSATARLPSAIAAVISVWATMRMAERAATPRAGLLAGAVLATSFMFWEKARMAQIDSLLCCLITLALLAFSEYRAGRLSGRAAGIAFWAACALATLAKGPVGLVIPLGTAILVLAFERSLSRWRDFAPLLGPLTFAAIGGLWITALALWPVEGYSVLGALREHFVDRGLSGMHHARPWWYYAGVLPWASFPWSLLLPGAVIYAWRQRSNAAVRLPLVHCAFVVLFFSLSAEKRDLYILPALPAMAILVALFIESLLPSGERAATSDLSLRWLFVPLRLVGAVVILAGLVVPALAYERYPDLRAASAVFALIFVSGGALITNAAWRARPAAAVRYTILAMAAVLFGVATGYPALNAKKSGRALAGEVARAVATMGEPEVPIAGLDISNVVRPINLYSGGLYLQTMEAGETQQLLDLLAAGRPFVLVADRASLPPFDPADARRLVEVYETHLSRRDLVVFKVEGR